MYRDLPKPKYKESLKMKIAQWAYDSHYWIEYHNGYWRCKWCGANQTSEMALDENYANVCIKNPLIRRWDIGNRKIGL